MTRYFLDPFKKRGELWPGRRKWYGKLEGKAKAGCLVAQALSKVRYVWPDSWGPWTNSSWASEGEETALLPWEVADE